MNKTIKYKKLFYSLFITMTLVFSSVTTLSQKSYAACCPTCPCSSCCGFVGQASSGCTVVSTNETGTPGDPATTLGHITKEFQDHKKWMVDSFLTDNKKGNTLGVFEALMLMTNEISTIAMANVQTVGMFFDAKHQLETQRIFQTLTAKAHKDYQPSEGMCDFGSSIKSLAPSNEIAKIASNTLTNRSIDRQTLSKDTVTTEGYESDKRAELIRFIKDFCDKNDNAGNLGLLCKKSSNKKLLFNRDIDFTKTISAPLTLDIDLTSTTGSNLTDDEKSLFALMNNLFANETFPQISQNKLVNDNDTKLSIKGYEAILDQRALMAKRSVAVNSIASIAALKSKGDNGSQPFIYAILSEMGSKKMPVAEIQQLLGDNPSYHAQMEVLTKIIYQDPNFYTELLDKPANVARKEVAIQAADLMQKRDIYRSLLRSEAVIATMLETALMEEKDVVENKINRATDERGAN